MNQAPAARRPPTAFRPRYIDEYTGPTVNPLSATSTPRGPTSRFYGYDLTARAREGKPTTMTTRNPIRDEPTALRFYEHDLTARGGAGRPSTATTRHARRDEPTAPSNVDSYKKGGMVKKTGLAYLHKGEMVIPKKDVKKVKKMLK